jgi:hypothetical protein
MFLDLRVDELAAISLFSLFCRKSSAIEISFSAEILGRARYGERNNSEAPAVISLFSAVLVEPRGGESRTVRK